jgi:hypothetical protein
VVPGRLGLRSVDSEPASRVIEPRKLLPVGPTTLNESEGHTEPRRNGEERFSPPGSESGACWQGFSRNLGDLAVSVEDNGWGAVDQNPGPQALTPCPTGANKEHKTVPAVRGKRGRREGQQEVGAPRSTAEAGEPNPRDPVEERGRRVREPQ